MWRSGFPLLRAPAWASSSQGACAVPVLSALPRRVLGGCFHPLGDVRVYGPWVNSRSGTPDQAGKKFERKKMRVASEAVGRSRQSSLGPPELRNLSLGRCPWLGLWEKVWVQIRGQGSEGHGRCLAFVLVHFIFSKYVHIILLLFYLLISATNTELLQ